MLTPPDKKQCQAIKNTGSFMSFGKPTSTRCTSVPVVIATEKKAGVDGEIGSMSLCASCKAAMINQLGEDFAEFTEI